MSLSFPPPDTIPNNAERSKDHCSMSGMIKYFVRVYKYKLFPLLSSQLLGHLPHFPHAVYMVLLENDWVQSNWPVRSCKNCFFILRFNRFTELYCWMCSCVFLSVVSLFCPEQRRSYMSGRSAWRRSKKSWRKWRRTCLCTLAQQEEVRHPAQPHNKQVMAKHSRHEQQHPLKIAQWSVLQLHHGLAGFPYCNLCLFLLMRVTSNLIFTFQTIV